MTVGEGTGLRSLAELEEERDFLLRSIDDLDLERDAGDIAPDDYHTLKQDYTARAAAVLRSIDQLRAPVSGEPGLAGPGSLTAPRSVGAVGVAGPEGSDNAAGLAGTAGSDNAAGLAGADSSAGSSRTAVDVGSTPGSRSVPARSSRRTTLLRAGVIIGVVGFAIAAGVLVERGAGQRVAGQSSSGSITQTGSGADIAKAQQLFAAGQLLPALQTLSDVLKKDPTNVEALTFTGWFTRLTAKQVNHPELVDKALGYLVRAEEADPSYGPAHLFRGITLFEDKGDATAAIPELQTFLAAPHSPDEQGQLSAVRDILARAVAATTTTVARP